MHPVIESHRHAVSELCKRSGVNRLELFGSAARDDFDVVTSDIDLLVEFSDLATSPGLSPYFDLKDALEKIFSRSVDLVEIDTVRNPYVRAQIDRDRQLLYAP